MKGQSMSVKTYTAPQQVLCMPILDNCKNCQEKDDCLVLREQLAFYNRLGISQINDEIDAEAFIDIRPLLKVSSHRG